MLERLTKIQSKVVKAMLFSQGNHVNPTSGRVITSIELSKYNLPTLCWRRREHCLILLWKLFNRLGPPQLVLPPTAADRSERSLRSPHALEFPRSSSSLRLSSFLCVTIPLWNSLPNSVVLSKSPSAFRSSLRSHFKDDKFSFYFSCT